MTALTLEGRPRSRASLIRNSEAAPAVVQLVLFLLVFISGSWPSAASLRSAGAG